MVDPVSNPITNHDTRRYLVVANRTTTSESLQHVLEDRIASGTSSFRVLVPAPYVDMSTIVPLGMDSVGGLLYRLTASQEAEELQFANDRLQALLQWLWTRGHPPMGRSPGWSPSWLRSRPRSTSRTTRSSCPRCRLDYLGG